MTSSCRTFRWKKSGTPVLLPCFSSALAPAHLHGFLLFSPPLLTHFMTCHQWVRLLFHPTFFAMCLQEFSFDSEALSLTALPSPSCPPPPVQKSLPVHLVSATLPNFLVYGLACPMACDVPFLLNWFLLSQLLGIFL